MAKVSIFVALAICLMVANAKQFSRCGLVKELRNQGFPETLMRDWVCLVEAESSRRTDKKSKMNSNGSYDYGLFQINDKYWCSNTDKPGKDCNVKCGDLLTDDITKAATCAQKVYRRHKFQAWYGWKNKCQGALPDISAC